MFCQNCGIQLPNGAKFCYECGTRVGKSILVPAKCTNCNANLQVSKNLEAAICPYCGTPYIVEKAIQNYIYIQGINPKNFMALSNDALRTGNHSQAMDYAQKALENDPKNIEAWILKMKIAGKDLEGDRSSEIYSYVECVLDKDDSIQTQIKIYNAVLEVAKNHIKEAIKLLDRNVETIMRQQKERRMLLSDIAAMDSGYVIRTSQLVNEAIEYRNIVPTTLITHPMVQKEVQELAMLHNQYYDALEQRYQLYGTSLSTRQKNKKQENYQKILGRL